jgi:histidinol-phosphate aminotransferase
MRALDPKTLALYPPREPGEKLVAEFMGTEASEILLTNGADEGIDLLCRAYLEPENEIVIVVPTFNMYEIFALSSGATVVKLATGPDFSFPLDKVLGAINPRTRLVVITNPHNPTGTVASRNEILKVLEAAPEAAVLVDEAYFDFYGETMMDLAGKLPNLFIARTFSKAYGLAGIRLGVLAGAVEQISVLRRMCSPFNVNVFALECLAEALGDKQFVADYVKQVRATREWLRQKLELLGFRCWPSHANFVLVNFGELRQAILAAMESQGIALRDRPDCPGCVRISIGTQPEMELVVAVLEQVLSEKSLEQQVSK